MIGPVSESSTTRVVILGGGFAGVYTAMALERIWGGSPHLRVTVINRENHFVITPLLFEAGSGVLEPRHAVSPIRPMLRYSDFVKAAVERIDIDARKITARLAQNETREIEFDHLVLALGGETNTRIIPGAEHARTFKTLRDAISLRNHCIAMFERADVETDLARKRKLLTFVIIGGGLVGVELQGEFTEFIKNIQPAYRNIAENEIRMVLIEGGPRLVPEMDAELGEYAEKVLRRRGVDVRDNTRANRLEGSQVHLPGETIEAGTIIVVTGVVPNPLIASLPLEKDKKGRLVVAATMQCPSNTRVWGLGDCAAIPDPSGKPYPMLAQHALREARMAAKNITAVIRGGQPQPFIYKSKGTLAALGHYQGMGRVGKLRIHGFIGWWVWRTYYLSIMPRFSRKLRLVMDWTIALFFRNDVVELDMTPPEAAHFP